MPSVTDPSLGRALDRLTSRTDQPGPDDVFGAFVDWTAEQGITLYPAQEEALIEVVSGANVILGTPTGSGKSLVALGAHVSALAAGGRTFYTAPIKALVSEKFFALCDVLGPERVGMLTGDASVNAEARLVCCTAEVLANIALREEGVRHRPGRHGRVPLLHRAGAGLGVAGPAAGASPGHSSFSCRRHSATPPVRGGPRPAHRARRSPSPRVNARFRSSTRGR